MHLPEGQKFHFSLHLDSEWYCSELSHQSILLHILESFLGSIPSCRCAGSEDGPCYAVWWILETQYGRKLYSWCLIWCLAVTLYSLGWMPVTNYLSIYLERVLDICLCSLDVLFPGKLPRMYLFTLFRIFFGVHLLVIFTYQRHLSPCLLTESCSIFARLLD